MFFIKITDITDIVLSFSPAGRISPAMEPYLSIQISILSNLGERFIFLVRIKKLNIADIGGTIAKKNTVATFRHSQRIKR